MTEAIDSIPEVHQRLELAKRERLETVIAHGVWKCCAALAHKPFGSTPLDLSFEAYGGRAAIRFNNVQDVYYSEVKFCLGGVVLRCPAEAPSTIEFEIPIKDILHVWPTALDAGNRLEVYATYAYMEPEPAPAPVEPADIAAMDPVAYFTKNLFEALKIPPEAELKRLYPNGYGPSALAEIGRAIRAVAILLKSAGNKISVTPPTPELTRAMLAGELSGLEDGDIVRWLLEETEKMKESAAVKKKIERITRELISDSPDVTTILGWCPVVPGSLTLDIDFKIDGKDRHYCATASDSDDARVYVKGFPVPVARLDCVKGELRLNIGPFLRPMTDRVTDFKVRASYAYYSESLPDLEDKTGHMPKAESICRELIADRPRGSTKLGFWPVVPGTLALDIELDFEGERRTHRAVAESKATDVVGVPGQPEPIGAIACDTGDLDLNLTPLLEYDTNDIRVCTGIKVYASYSYFPGSETPAPLATNRRKMLRESVSVATLRGRAVLRHKPLPGTLVLDLELRDPQHIGTMTLREAPVVTVSDVRRLSGMSGGGRVTGTSVEYDFNGAIPDGVSFAVVASYEYEVPESPAILAAPRELEVAQEIPGVKSRTEDVAPVDPETERENTAARLYHLERVSKQWEIEHERLSAENIRLQNELSGKDQAIGDLCMAQMEVAKELGVDISAKGPLDAGFELAAAIRANRNLSTLRALREQVDQIHRILQPPMPPAMSYEEVYSPVIGGSE